MSKEQSQEYRGNGNHKPEPVHKEAGVPIVERLRVPGGWIYFSTKFGWAVTVDMPDIVKENHHPV